ncbi:hypothetical protein FACS189437_06010 [Bacteroidia bacterium]|nr:hypothetical protein FACS189437_06010 [Bacteroidia bacterium]
MYSQVCPDSVDIAYYSKKDALNTNVQIVGLNMGVWVWGRYVRKQPFAYIDFNTMKTNFRKGFSWDLDGIDVNMLAHPYHGSIYFNSARSNGYNFWQSGIYALGGSAMWELIMESEYPSTSDILATPAGGMAMGETFYRMSDLVLDDRKTGSDRFGSELVACLISPSRGLTRILSGDAWKRRSTSGRQFGISDYQLEVSSGIQFRNLKDVNGKKTDAVVNINMEYGDRFSDENRIPYDYFTLDMDVSTAIASAVSHASITGRYAVTGLVDTQNSFLNLGIYQHFDYYSLDSISGKIPYRLGVPVAGGIGIFYQNKSRTNFQLDGYAHLNGIILGALYTDYFRASDKDYNMASGLGWKSGVNLAVKNRFSFSAAYEGYRLFTWAGYPKGLDDNEIQKKTFNIQGDESQATFQVIEFKANIPLGKQFYLSGSYRSLTRHTNYKEFPAAFSQTGETTFKLGYRF